MLIFAHKTMKDWKSVMKKKLYNILSIMFMSVLFVTSCGDNTEQSAEILFQQASEQCDSGNYDKTIALIDTLRNKYPKAIEVRKKALKLYADASEKQAEERLSEIDARLQEAESKYSEMKAAVEKHKKEGKATADELTAFTLMRMHRDSIQTMFDTECEKIKYIRKKRQQDME